MNKLLFSLLAFLAVGVFYTSPALAFNSGYYSGDCYNNYYQARVYYPSQNYYTPFNYGPAYPNRMYTPRYYRYVPVNYYYAPSRYYW